MNESMMKIERIIARKSNESKTGYELVFIDENQNEEIHLIESTYNNEPFTLILPENELNRKYLNSKKIDNAGGELELKSIERIQNGEKSVSRKSLIEYMTPDDLQLYNEILERAKKRREEMTKKTPLTEIQKAELKLKKAQEAYEKLMKEIQG